MALPTEKRASEREMRSIVSRIRTDTSNFLLVLPLGTYVLLVTSLWLFRGSTDLSCAPRKKRQHPLLRFVSLLMSRRVD